MNKMFCKFIYFFKRSELLKILRENDILTAVSYIDNYKKTLEKSLNINHKEIVNQELNFLKNFSINYISKLAEKALKSNDIFGVLKGYDFLCLNYLADIRKLKNPLACLDKINLPDLESTMMQESQKIKNNLKKNEIICDVYNKNGMNSRTKEYYDKYLTQTAKDGLSILDYYYMLGTIYYMVTLSMPKLNVDYLNKAVSLYNKIYSYHCLKYNILRCMMHSAIVLRDYELVYNYFNKYVESGYNVDCFLALCYSCICMRNKDFENWKKYYYIGYDFVRRKALFEFNKPRWTGKEDISDSVLLIVSNNGFGDDFLMWGYMPRIKKLAKKVIFLMNDLTCCLFKDNDLGIEVYPISSTKNLEYDYYILSMHIPISLNITIKDVSVHGGYIKADKALVNTYKEKYFNTNKFKIGIAFNGDVAMQEEDAKNIPVEELKILDNLDNVQFYCFTKDIEDKQLNVFKRNSIINIAKEFSSFSDTAAAIENVDIVVSSDNCILNLAGAMGKTSIGIFNYNYVAERWFVLSEYECKLFDSIKPIINNFYDDWEISLNKAVDKIKYIMSNKSERSTADSLPAEGVLN